MAKYHNRKTVINNITFASAREAARYQELCLLERAGAISDLRLQPRYELQPKFRRDGKTIRAITYVGDFEYRESDRLIVEDSKGGVRTQVFEIKAKMFQFRYPEIELRVTA